MKVLITPCEGCHETQHGSVYATERRSQEEESGQDALRGSGQAAAIPEKAEGRLRRRSALLFCFRLHFCFRFFVLFHFAGPETSVSYVEVEI
jgi:hypothetical protein